MFAGGGAIIIVTPLPGSRPPAPPPLNAAVARGGAVQLRDVEAELEAEQRRGRELQAENRKLSRSLQELRTQSDDERRAMNELADQVNTLQLRIKTLRRQLEEAVCLGHISNDLLFPRLGCIARTQCKDAVYCYRCSVVSASECICLFVGYNHELC